MNKIYFTAPLCGMLVFGALFYFSQRGASDREAEKIRNERAARETALKAEANARQEAIAGALRTQELRKKERAEKEAREAEEQTARQKLIEQRDRTFREQDKLAKQIDRLKKEIENEQLAAAKIQEEMKGVESERRFLAEFVRQAGANVKALETVLAKIGTEAPRTTEENVPKKAS